MAAVRRGRSSRLWAGALMCLLRGNLWAQTPEQQLEWALSAYQNGGCPEAAAQLSELLYPLKLTSREDIRVARLHLGLCSFVLGDEDEAEREFRQVLLEAPELSLDPVLTPPALLDFFEQVRQRVLQEQAPPPATLTPSARARSFFLDVAPLGLAQFDQGHDLKGSLLFTGEFVLTFSTAATYAWLVQNEGIPPTEDAYQLREQVRTANHLFFVATTAVFSFGLVDGLYHGERLRWLGPRLTPGTSSAELGMTATWSW